MSAPMAGCGSKFKQSRGGNIVYLWDLYSPGFRLLLK